LTTASAHSSSNFQLEGSLTTTALENKIPSHIFAKYSPSISHQFDNYSDLKHKIVGMDYRPDIHSQLISKCDAKHDILDIEVKQIADEVPFDNCIECKIPLKILEDVMVCGNCGLEKDFASEYNPETYSVAIDGNYNSSTTSCTSFTFSGKKSYGYQKAILKSCSDYSTTSLHTIRKEILHRINLYNGNKPPMDVQLRCIEIYYSIKENDKLYLNIVNQGVAEHNEKKRLVFRSNGKWGLIAACLGCAFNEAGLTRTPREICEILCIEDKYLSAGEKKLHEFIEYGIIDISTNNTNILDDFINRYFPLLNIPDKYKQFITDIISQAERKGLHICNTNRTSTKCIGAIFLLCTRIPELNYVTREYLARECKLSKPAFVRYYTVLLYNWPLLKNVFKKHQIPMPKEWRQK
jgi:hypothetical protein